MMWLCLSIGVSLCAGAIWLGIFYTTCFDDEDPDMFWDDAQYMADPKTCPHPKSSHTTIVLESAVTCETTVTACTRCGTYIDEPKTDCA